MNPILPIKKYFTERVSKNGRFTEHKEAFNSENLSKAKFDRAFQIGFGALRPGRNPNTSIIEVKVKLFFDLKRDTQTQFIDAYGQVIAFKSECLKAEYFGNADGISNIAFTEISEPQPLEENGRAVIFETKFDVTGVFNVGDEIEL